MVFETFFDKFHNIKNTQTDIFDNFTKRIWIYNFLLTFFKLTPIFHRFNKKIIAIINSIK